MIFVVWVFENIVSFMVLLLSNLVNWWLKMGFVKLLGY